MRNITNTVYQYNELSDEAKEKAREWYVSGYEFEHDAEWVTDDAKAIGALMGIDIDDTAYSGFWSQGDGASFTGRYQYAKGAVKAVKEYAPQDTEVARIAKALQDVQKKYFYKLCAGISTSGRYSHSGTMDVSVYHADDDYRDIGEAEDDITTLMRDFADWMYRELEKAYEWGVSDEQVEENIIANEYEFTEDGERA